MRYQIDPGTGGMGAPVGDNGMIIGSAIYGLLLGIAFFYMGKRSRLLWVTVIGVFLVGSSVVYLGAAMLGFT